MRTIAILTAGFLVLSATRVPAQHRFSVGVTAAPTYAYANTTQIIYLPSVYVPAAPVGSTNPLPVEFTNRSHTWGYNTGVMAHYAFTPSWSVSTGFWYSRAGATTTFPFAPGAVAARLISRNLQVPLFINYRSSQRRLSPYFSVGALANIRQSTLFRPEAGSGLSDTKVVFGRSAVTYRALLGAGVAYTINSHLSLIAQPLLDWSFKPNGSYTHFVAYQINGQTQLLYSF